MNPEIVIVLGEQLVSDPLTALSELVKNSYDADAHKVTIRFSKTHDSILIEDDGHGMSLHDIRTGWLEIGSGNKRRRTGSRKGRVLTGSMGIGRLAAFSIANRIIAETGEKSSPWRSFSLDFRRISSAKDLSKARISIRVLSERPADQGTIITLRDLKWFPTDFQEVRRRLSVLASPLDIADFQIYIESEGKVEEIEPDKDLPAAPLIVASRVDDQGHATTTIRANPALYEGSLAKTEWPDNHKGQTYPALRGISLEAYWYALGERPGRRYWKTTLESQRLLKDISGIRIYRDSIRVLPYGETGDDWLRLEKRYVQLGPQSRRPRASQIVGWIRITREGNPSLGDVANRQGLKDNEGYHELRRFGQSVFDVLAEVRRQIEPIVSRREELSPEDRPEIEKALDTVRSAISWNPALVERFSLIEKAIDVFFEQSEVMALYRDRLTAGLLASIVMHEVGVPLNAATPVIMRAAVETCQNPQHRRAFQMVETFIPKIKEGYLLLAGARAGDYRVRELDASEVVSVTVQQMRAVSSSEKVRIEPEIVGVNRAKVRRSDLWAIVTNLIANAIQAADYEHARGRTFPDAREIVVSLSTANRDLVITCEDNGPGLPDKPEGWIWEAFNTTKPNGSGLGLYIVSDIVAWYSGTKFATASKRFASGALFRITLPGVAPIA